MMTEEEAINEDVVACFYDDRLMLYGGDDSEAVSLYPEDWDKLVAFVAKHLGGQ